MSETGKIKFFFILSKLSSILSISKNRTSMSSFSIMDDNRKVASYFLFAGFLMKKLIPRCSSVYLEFFTAFLKD